MASYNLLNAYPAIAPNRRCYVPGILVGQQTKQRRIEGRLACECWQAAIQRDVRPASYTRPIHCNHVSKYSVATNSPRRLKQSIERERPTGWQHKVMAQGGAEEVRNRSFTFTSSPSMEWCGGGTAGTPTGNPTLSSAALVLRHASASASARWRHAKRVWVSHVKRHRPNHRPTRTDTIVFNKKTLYAIRKRHWAGRQARKTHPASAFPFLQIFDDTPPAPPFVYLLQQT